METHHRDTRRTAGGDEKNGHGRVIDQQWKLSHPHSTTTQSQKYITLLQKSQHKTKEKNNFKLTRFSKYKHRVNAFFRENLIHSLAKIVNIQLYTSRFFLKEAAKRHFSSHFHSMRTLIQTLTFIQHQLMILTSRILEF